MTQADLQYLDNAVNKFRGSAFDAYSARQRLLESPQHPLAKRILKRTLAGMRADLRELEALAA
jgi:hypothetical protein